MAILENVLQPTLLMQGGWLDSVPGCVYNGKKLTVEAHTSVEYR